MGCSCSNFFKAKHCKVRRHSTFYIRTIHFSLTYILEIDQFFARIKLHSRQLATQLQNLRIAKSRFYHQLSLPSLFAEPTANLSVISLVLYLVASGTKIEFIDMCPYLEIEGENEVFELYKKYIESLHEGIIAVIELKPELQDYILKSKDYAKRISHIADDEGFDLCQKLNLVAIFMKNCRILWEFPEILDNRLWSVKRDLNEVRNGFRECVGVSIKFELIFDRFKGLSPVDTIRQVWANPHELIAI